MSSNYLLLLLLSQFFYVVIASDCGNFTGDVKNISNPNCTYASGRLKYPNCVGNVIVNWLNYPPYIFSDGNGNIDGIFKPIIEKVVRHCCGDCVNFTYLDAVNSTDALISRIGSCQSTLNFPVQGPLYGMGYDNFPFFPVIPSPGIIYFKKTLPPGSQEDPNLSAIIVSWPILVLIIISSVLAGFVIWVLDSYKNADQFPHFFVHGTWQGFWWAFVSMTTVGYGDKAPLSFGGRLFSFVWVLFGMVIISIFTSTVTTTLTTSSLENDLTLQGKTIISLDNTEIKSYAENNNAKIMSASSVEEFVRKLVEGPTNGSERIDGGLVDAYVAGNHQQYMKPNKNMSFATVFDHEFSYGLVTTNDLEDAQISKCIRTEILNNENYVIGLIRAKLKALPEPKNKGKDLMNPDNRVFVLTVYICLGTSLFLILCAIAWEYLYFRPRLPKKESKVCSALSSVYVRTSFERLVVEQCEELEKIMIREVSTLYENFKQKIEKVREMHVTDTSLDILHLPDHNELQQKSEQKDLRKELGELQKFGFTYLIQKQKNLVKPLSEPVNA